MLGLNPFMKLLVLNTWLSLVVAVVVLVLAQVTTVVVAVRGVIVLR
jgi:hypothetical protein